VIRVFLLTLLEPLIRMMRWLGLGLGEKEERNFRSWIQDEDETLIRENGKKEERYVRIHFVLYI